MDFIIYSYLLTRSTSGSLNISSGTLFKAKSSGFTKDCNYKNTERGRKINTKANANLLISVVKLAMWNESVFKEN